MSKKISYQLEAINEDGCLSIFIKYLVIILSILVIMISFLFLFAEIAEFFSIRLTNPVPDYAIYVWVACLVLSVYVGYKLGNRFISWIQSQGASVVIDGNLLTCKKNAFDLTKTKITFEDYEYFWSGADRIPGDNSGTYYNVQCAYFEEEEKKMRLFSEISYSGSYIEGADTNSYSFRNNWSYHVAGRATFAKLLDKMEEQGFIEKNPYKFNVKDLFGRKDKLDR